MILEPAQNIPVMDEADVVVVGGGPAGVSAAISAKRNDAKKGYFVRKVLYLHNWGCRALVEEDTVKGVVFESKEGRQAILG